jgi:MscS family membrane protein
MELELELGVFRTWLQELGIQEQTYQNAIEIFLIVLATGALSFVVKRVLSHLEVQFLKTSNLWDDTLLNAARRPITCAIWIFGLSLAAYSSSDFSDSEVLGLVTTVQRIGIIGCFTWFMVRFISGAETLLVSPERMSEPMDETTVSAIGKLLRASVIITSILVGLQTLGYSISGVLAFGGIGGIAVGFAAKDLLANFFGGLMVYLDRPFKVGDWVRSPDKEIEGTVEAIGWRLTTIRTFEKRPLYVPNSVFTNISVQNPSRMSHRRIYETVGLRYDDAAQLQSIIDEVKQMLIDHDDLDTTQTLIVNFNAFGSSSLDFFIYTFTKTTDWIRYHEVKQDVLFKVMNIVAKQGAEVAFPTSTVHLSEPLQALEAKQSS